MVLNARRVRQSGPFAAVAKAAIARWVANLEVVKGYPDKKRRGEASGGWGAGGLMGFPTA